MESDHDNLLCPVSPGELFDKISILEIKLERLTSSKAKQYIRKELAMLTEIKERFEERHDSELLPELYRRLVVINSEIWESEERRRAIGISDSTIKEIAEISIESYKLNDWRAATKKEINDLTQSSIREFKSYKDLWKGRRVDI